MSAMAASPEPFTVDDLRAAQAAIAAAQERTLVVVCPPDRADEIATALEGRPGKTTVKTSRHLPDGMAYVIDVTPQILTDKRLHSVLVSDLTLPRGGPPTDPLGFADGLVDG